MDRFDLFPNNSLIDQYRRVFSSNNGKDVLSHILFDLGVFIETAGTEEEATLKKYGLRLLNILGGGEPGEHAIREFTMHLMRQQLEKEAPNE